MLWKHEPQKCKIKKSVNKLMCTVFRDHKGILLVDWMPRGMTINSGAYRNTLGLLRREIRERRSELLRNDVNT